MDICELLELAKKNNDLESDYALHKLAEINKQQISAFRKGTEKPGAYEIFRLAILAGIDPVQCLADIKAETERNETKREFWRDFRQHAGKAAMIVLALSFTVSSLPDATSGGLNGTAHYAKFSAWLRRRSFARRAASRGTDRRQLVAI
jgi:hypothetical protein